MELWVLLLAAVGLWLLIEGLAYALAPDAMRRLLEWSARLPAGDLRQGGFWAAILGAICLYGAVRLI